MPSLVRGGSLQDRFDDLLDVERLTHGREVLALAPGQGRDLGELAREHEGPHALVRQGVRRGRPEVTDEALGESPVADAD